MLPQAYHPVLPLWEKLKISLFSRPLVVGAISDCQARIGDRILTDLDPTRIPNVCDCYTIEGNAMRLLLERLGTIIDTQKGELSYFVFQGISGRFGSSVERVTQTCFALFMTGWPN